MENNFSSLLGTKKLKISKVHEDTGIARSTLTGLYYGHKNVNLVTLRKLCDYLQVPLSDLIEYMPKKLVKQ
ncbi:helix-turn-helix domain-containing protein [Secundilactobacillus malefermentans]|uniref:helix-turn-helix domain-containing protein n=1 Tax=Secundilactobacillus malefermentans TaxID=176292 RepID=UPI0011C90020|nr:helix-turn-helix transcriptional regulator [Secundilactobacillus malefermentans]QEA32116.1 helix-turn-helix transcriptional regulator [Secundilactobacillus malefermentans]